jgi:hypothetical protein
VLCVTENSILAPHIHGELLKLGFEVAQSSVAKYMVVVQSESTVVINYSPPGHRALPPRLAAPSVPSTKSTGREK